MREKYDNSYSRKEICFYWYKIKSMFDCIVLSKLKGKLLL
jgi:hypothetical protein